MKKRICIGCGFEGNIYDFSPSIQVGDDDFRIFHAYNKQNGHLFCVTCKKKHLIKIAKYKKLNEKQVDYLKNSIMKE